MHGLVARSPRPHIPGRLASKSSNVFASESAGKKKENESSQILLGERVREDFEDCREGNKREKVG